MLTSSSSAETMMEYLESIVSRYQGEAKVQRLQWLIQTILLPSSPMTTGQGDQQQGGSVVHNNDPTNIDSTQHLINVIVATWLALAHHYRDTGNTYRYRDLLTQLQQYHHSTAMTPIRNSNNDNHMIHPHETSAASFAMNVAIAASSTVLQQLGSSDNWLHSQEMKNRQARDVLQSRLSQAQAHLHKEAIRAAYLALAEHELKVMGSSSSTGSSSLTLTTAAHNHSNTAGTEAFHYVLRAKDYCVTRPQTASVSLQILEVALALHNYGAVREFVTKLEHTLEAGFANTPTAAPTSNNPASSSPNTNGVNLDELAFHRVKVASALEALSRNEFARAGHTLFDLTTGVRLHGGWTSTASTSAASRSGSATTESGGGGGTSAGSGAGPSSSTSASVSPSSSVLSWPTVLCGEEIALYASMLTLAVLPRVCITQLAEDAEALELVPYMRECLRYFYRAKYCEAWNMIPWNTRIQCDPYLGPHLQQLQELVIQRTILSYWEPYNRVPVSIMTQELHGIVPNAEYLLQHMIDVIGKSHAPPPSSSQQQQGSTTPSLGMATAFTSSANNTNTAITVPLTKLMDTRIDLPNQILVRNDPDSMEEIQQVTTEAKVQDLTTQVLDDTYSMVVRLACLEQDIVVVSSSSEGGGGGGGSDGRRGTKSRGGLWRRTKAAASNLRRGMAPTAIAGGGGRNASPRNINDERDLAAAGIGVDDSAGNNINDPEELEDDMISSDEEEVSQEDEEDDDGEEDIMLDVADDMNPEDLY